MMMTDFVHCNYCFCLPSVDVKYYLTTCSHLFCSKCINNGIVQNNVCKKCGRSCDLLLLSGNVKSDIKMFFEPVHQLLEKIEKVDKFQKSQRNHLLSHLAKERAKRKENESKMELKISLLKRELDLLKSKMTKTKDTINFSSLSPRNSITSSRNSGIRPIFGEFVGPNSECVIMQNKIIKNENKIRIPETLSPNLNQNINLKHHEGRIFSRFRSNLSRMS